MSQWWQLLAMTDHLCPGHSQWTSCVGGHLGWENRLAKSQCEHVQTISRFHGQNSIQRTNKDENDRKTSACSGLGSDLHCGQGTTNISTKYWMAWPRCVCNRFQILGAFACARSDFPSFPSLKHLWSSSCHTPIDKDSVSSWIWTYLNWGHERCPQLDTGALQSINKSLRWTNLPTCGKPPRVLSHHQRRRWFKPCVKMAGYYKELPYPVASLTIWFHDPLLGWLTSYRRPKLRHPMRSSYISKQRKRVEISAYLQHLRPNWAKAPSGLFPPPRSTSISSWEDRDQGSSFEAVRKRAININYMLLSYYVLSPNPILASCPALRFLKTHQNPEISTIKK